MAWLTKVCLLAFVAFTAGLTDDLSFKDEIVRDEDWLDPTNMFISKSSYNNDVRKRQEATIKEGDEIVVRPLTTRCVRKMFEIC